MRLYLVQHGRNLPKDEDPEKGLSREGEAEVERMATTAAGHNLTVSVIRHSGKKRARQTAEIFARALEPEGGVEETAGLGPLDDVTRFDPAKHPDAMLVGHLPFMEKLVAHLSAGDADQAPVFKFQHGGIVCLTQNESGKWFIAWALVPRIE